MALKYEIADLNEVPEAVRGEYAEHTDDAGKKTFRLGLDLPAGHSVEDVSGLKSALSKERTSVKTLSDAEKAAKARVTELETQLAGVNVDQLQAELKTLREAHASSETRLQSAIASNQISAAIAQHRGNAELLVPLVEKRTRVKEGAVVVVDDAGQVRDGVTVSDLVAELRENPSFGGAFAGSGKSGGGAGGGNSNSAPAFTTTKRRSQMTLAEKAAAMRELGTDGFMALPQ